MAEKSEKATPKKLRDARKKGQVAKSQDFPSAFTFVVSILGTIVASGYLYSYMGNYLVATFRSISSDLDMQTKGGAYILEAINVIMLASLPVLIVVVIVGLIVNFLVIGPLFSFESMKFDLKKLNPITGLKQKFKLKVLVELIKSILKITGAAVIIGVAIWKMLPDVIGTSSVDVITSSQVLQTFLKKISIEVGIFFLAVAIFDLAFQKKTFAKEMMMEKFEVKQEYKDTEGDPLIKGKRKERAREIAYSAGPSAARRAKAIITNPTHIAVAIGFENEKDVVPIILTMGCNNIAQKIIQVAMEEKKPIMRNVELARILYYKGNISDYIPEETYKAIAEILKWIATLEKEEKALEIFT